MASQDIVIGTKVDLNGLKKGEQQVKSSVDGMSKSFSGTATTAVAGFGTALLSVGVAVAGASVAIYSLADATAEMADETWKASQRMGVSLEFYQKMSSASEHAGTTIATMTTGMKTLVNSMQQVDEGSANAIRAFEDLGVSVFDANGEMRDQEEVFTEALINLADMDNETKRTALSIKLLGRAGQQLAPLLNEGSDAIRQYIVENESAVLVSQNLADESQRYNDAMQTLGETLTQTKNTAIEPVVTAFADLAEKLLESDVNADIFIDGMENVATVVEKVTGVLIDVAYHYGLLTEKEETTSDRTEEFLHTLQGALDGYSAESLVAQLQNQNTALELAQQQLADYHKFAEENGFEVDDEVYTNLVERHTRAIEMINAETASRRENNNATNDGTEAVIKNNEARQKLAKELPIVIDLTNQRIEQEAILAKQMEEKIFLQSQKAENDMSDTKPDFDQMKMDFAQQSFQFTEDLADIAMNNSINREQRKIDALKKAQSEELSGFIGSNRRRQQIEAKNAKEIEERERELAKKRGKMQIAQSWADAGRGIVGTWSQALSSTAPPFAIPMAIASSAMMTGIATAQTASIASAMQGFATGGIVGGGGVAPSQGADNTVATLRDTEMVLNAEQQTQLFEMANGAGGGGINIVINGNVTQDHLSELEDNIRALQNNGRTNFEVVS